jgi:hypothetical protein
MKLETEEMYLNIIKAIYDKPIANIMLKWEKVETISPNVRNETRMPTLSTPIPSQRSKTGRRNRSNTNR